MMNDPTIQRIWNARKKISKKCDFDSKKLVAYYIERQKEKESTGYHFVSEETNTYDSK
ncbi:MAG: hypothetical protein PF692_14245 [Kiritimatiellae bacterium]|jgi:hypothetical protein|nr:hypothetical protein [Kiritimatiellia bacterium]